jgi:hypothetical protein
MFGNFKLSNNFRKKQMLQLFYLFIYERSPTPLLIQKTKKSICPSLHGIDEKF